MKLDVNKIITEAITEVVDDGTPHGAYHGPGHEYDILPPKLGIKDHLYQAGSKAADATKKAAAEAAEYIKANPELSAAAAASLAAGVGGLAAIRKMRKMQKAAEASKPKAGNKK